MQKGFAPIFILVGILILAIVGGAYFLVNLKFPNPNLQINPVVTSQTPQATPVPPSVDETANWKTYTNDKLKLSFKYPELYKQNIISEPRNGVYLTRDTAYTAGGGQAGSDVLKKGAVISFTPWPAKSLAEKDLKSQFGDGIKINQITVNQKQGVEVILPNNQTDKHIYLQKDNGVLEVSLGVGFENNSSENQKYTSDFNQILSTFKFLP